MLVFHCTACNRELRVKEAGAGKRAKCPHCGKPLTIPAAAVAIAAQPVPPPPGQRQAGASNQALPHDMTGGIATFPTEETVELEAGAIRKEPANAFHNFLAPAQAPDEIGRLGPYRVLKVLGTGGMGVVFHAEDPQLRRSIALKALLPALAASTAARQRFLREAQSAAAIKHDHIVTIHQVGEDRGAPYLAMEFLEGEALEDRLRRDKKLPLLEVVRIGRQTALALAAAHKRGLIHRDIKPGNIWLEGEEGRVKILDFGLARAAGEDGHLTQAGCIIGTPAYMAPEQAQAQVLDARCDLFSLGAVLYRMSTGQYPFKGVDTMSILMSLAMDIPEPPRALNPDLPEALSDLIVNLLTKNRDQRLPTAQAVIAALDACLVNVAPAAAPPSEQPAARRPGAAVGQQVAKPQYCTPISRTNPTCFLFLVDQSSSMQGPFGQQPNKKKAEGVADAINGLLQNLVWKCAKSEGIRDYFHVGVIGYGAGVASAFTGAMKEQPFVPVSALADGPLRIEQRVRTVKDGAGQPAEQKYKFPVWFDPKADGKTPMCAALKHAREALEVFLGRYPECYPPLVVNITDGRSTDGNPLAHAKNVRDLTSADGNVLLFNAHVSEAPASPLEFPADEATLPDNFAKLLFRMSSPLPRALLEAARSDGLAEKDGARGFVFNADLVSVVRFLDIGTRVAQVGPPSGSAQK